MLFKDLHLKWSRICSSVLINLGLSTVAKVVVIAKSITKASKVLFIKKKKKSPPINLAV